MRAVKRELLAFALIGVLFFLTTGFDAFNTEQNYVGENPDQVEPGRLSLDDRIGFAIILNAGYATVSLVPASAETDFTPHFKVTVQLKPELGCISAKLDDAVRDAPDGSGVRNLGDQTKELVEAVLAAEQYNRGPLQRAFEAALAHSAFFFTGHVPEMSLGLAQVKPSVARAVLPPEELAIMSERELLEYLLDDCGSAYVASSYVAALLRAEPADRPLKALIGDVAAQYNGGGNTAYAAAVTSAFRLLTGADFNAPAENSAAAQNALRLCAVFETGLPNGRILVPAKDATGEDVALPPDDPLRQALAAAKAVSVTMNQWEPGPKSYLARLSQLRLDWTGNALRDLGVPPALPLLQHPEGDAATTCAVAAAYRDRASLGLVTITLPPGTVVPTPDPSP